jgi:hypothetical protein
MADCGSRRRVDCSGRLGISTSVVITAEIEDQKFLITSSLVKVLPADCCLRRLVALLCGDPLVSDLELVRIPALDPSWSSSPLIRGLLRDWTHKDDSRSLEPSFEQPCVPAMVFGVYPIFSLSVRARRSCPLRYVLLPGESGGDEETRTPDPLLAKEMLFQLSYVPLLSDSELDGGRFWTRTRDLCLIRAVL